jgi:hypothetical protein
LHDEIKKRASAMIEHTRERGGWALGTGSRVPQYLPDENFLTMLEAARDL